MRSIKQAAQLIVVVMAIGAWALPSTASAASWGVVGTAHTLGTAGIHEAFEGTAGSWGCAEVKLHVDVSAAALRVTGVTFITCVASGGGGAGCNVAPKATGLPWSITGSNPNNLIIDKVHIDVPYSGVCPLNGVTGTVTGTLTGGVWDAAPHGITFNDATGLTQDIAGFGPLTTSMNLTDAQASLTLS